MAKGSTGTSMGGTIEYTRMKKPKPAEEPAPRKRGACLNCAYYYQETCTFDGAPNPAKAWCDNFVSKKMPKKSNKGIEIWRAKQQKKRKGKKA